MAVQPEAMGLSYEHAALFETNSLRTAKQALEEAASVIHGESAQDAFSLRPPLQGETFVRTVADDADERFEFAIVKSSDRWLLAVFGRQLLNTTLHEQLAAQMTGARPLAEGLHLLCRYPPEAAAAQLQAIGWSDFLTEAQPDMLTVALQQGMIALPNLNDRERTATGSRALTLPSAALAQRLREIGLLEQPFDDTDDRAVQHQLVAMWEGIRNTPDKAVAAILAMDDVLRQESARLKVPDPLILASSRRQLIMDIPPAPESVARARLKTDAGVVFDRQSNRMTIDPTLPPEFVSWTVIPQGLRSRNEQLGATIRDLSAFSGVPVDIIEAKRAELPAYQPSGTRLDVSFTHAPASDPQLRKRVETLLADHGANLGQSLAGGLLE